MGGAGSQPDRDRAEDRYLVSPHCNGYKASISAIRSFCFTTNHNPGILGESNLCTGVRQPSIDKKNGESDESTASAGILKEERC